MKSRINLSKLEAIIESGELPEFASNRFADVSIVPVQPEPQPRGFYPEDYYLVTPHVDEVARFFIAIREAFARNRGYGGFKDELFLRLAEAGNWYTAHNPDASAGELLRAMLVEAYQFRAVIELEPAVLASAVAHMAIDNVSLLDRPDPLSDGRPRTPDEVREQLAALA
ncbi:MAG: hypothetical protein WCI29_13860 [Actinomycetes bacterium]